jgi:hypothetical protein
VCIVDESYWIEFCLGCLFFCFKMTKICNFINLCGCSIETRSNFSELPGGLVGSEKKVQRDNELKSRLYVYNMCKL